MDKELRQRAIQAIREPLPGIAAAEGRICSGGQFIASQKEKDRIVAEFAGDCVEMEGGSILIQFMLEHWQDFAFVS